MFHHRINGMGIVQAERLTLGAQSDSGIEASKKTFVRFNTTKLKSMSQNARQYTLT